MSGVYLRNIGLEAVPLFKGLVNSSRVQRPGLFKFVGLTMVTAGASLLAFKKNRFPFIDAIYNDIGFVEQPTLRSSLSSRSERKMKYKELCCGSIIGLMSGIMVGKISSLLVYLSIIGALVFEWLGNKRIINKRYTLQVVSTSMSRIIGNNVNMNNPFFKVSFLLTFILSAFSV